MTKGSRVMLRVLFLVNCGCKSHHFLIHKVGMQLAQPSTTLLDRWWLGIHQGAIRPSHLAYYLDECTFRFNRRSSRARG
jgi:hypothetical protein